MTAYGDRLMTPIYDQAGMVIYHGDAMTVLKGLPDESVQACVTSPPYWGLRDYGVDGQVGVEPTPDLYVLRLVQIFREVRRVLRSDGSLWLNLGDSYANDSKFGGTTGGKHAAALHGTQVGRAKRQTGLKPKDLVGIPWRVAFALQADGWWLRSDIIWSKPNPMPESVKDRPTKSHEYLFLLTKSDRYFYDHIAVQEPQEEQERTRRLREQARGLDTVYTLLRDRPHGQHSPGQTGTARTVAARQALAQKGMRNRRTVWTVATHPFPDAHFATFPPKLIEPCILAGSALGGHILDPFHGAGTTGMVAQRLGRHYVGIELNEDYIRMSLVRIRQQALML